VFLKTPPPNPFSPGLWLQPGLKTPFSPGWNHGPGLKVPGYKSRSSSPVGSTDRDFVFLRAQGAHLDAGRLPKSSAAVIRRRHRRPCRQHLRRPCCQCLPRPRQQRARAARIATTSCPCRHHLAVAPLAAAPPPPDASPTASATSQVSSPSNLLLARLG
jgi:hypothetical protein